MASSIAWFGNLPNESKQDALSAFAAAAGSVVSVEMDRRGRMGWVTYSSAAEAEAAVKLTGKDFNGREVKVEVATRDPTKPKPEREPRKPKAPAAGPAAAGAGGEAAPRAPTYADRVSVRGLPRDATEESVRAFFGPAGAIKKVSLGRITGIVYETAEGANAAVALSGKVFPSAAPAPEEGEVARGPRPLKVNLSARKTKKAKKADAPAAAAAAAPASSAGGKKGKKAAEPAAAGAAAGGDRRTRRVDVAGAAAGTTEEAVKAFFASTGVAISRVLLPSAEAGEGEKVITVTFEASEGADKAVAMSGTKLGGNAVTVTLHKGGPRNRRKGNKAAAGGEGGDAASPKEAGAGRKRKAEPVSAEEVANLVWVQGLETGATEESVRKLFAGYGKIAEVTIRANKVKTFAYVRYETAAGAEKAVASANKEGSAIKAEKANRPPRPAAAGPAAAGASE